MRTRIDTVQHQPTNVATGHRNNSLTSSLKIEATMSTPTNNLLSRHQVSSEAGSPSESPMSSPENHPLHPPSITSSFDSLPPAMSAQGTTPAPSDDHTDMTAHIGDVIPHDDSGDDDGDNNDDESLDNNRPRHSRPRHQYLPQSRPSTPPVPPTTATVLLHPLSHSMTAPTSSSGPMSSTASSSNTASLDPHRNHALSPFSLFTHNANGDHPVSTSKTLSIELSHPEVILMAGGGSVLEGIVYLNLHKNSKIKKLQLEFSGRSSVTWVDDNSYSPATRHTTAPHIEHTWTMIPHQPKQPPTQLQSGQHAFPFSLELPDTLPETLTTTHGKVSYRLTATLTKPGLTFNTTTITLPVIIRRRYPIHASRAYQQGGRATSGPEDKVKYKITLPQIRVPHSTKIPLQVSITAPTSQIHIQVLQVGLWEQVVYRADGRRRVDMRLVKIQKSEGWERPLNHETEAWNWNKVLLFDMPHMGSEMNQCNPTADNGLMKVAHTLRFSILGTDGPKRFRIEDEIDIRVLAMEDDYRVDPNEAVEEYDGELPSYLTSFTTPRVSFDSERDLDPTDDDLLRQMIHRIHLPTYAESEEDVNSRSTSRDVSQSTSRNASRSASPERSHSTGNVPFPHHVNHQHHHHHTHHHQPHPLRPLSTGHSPLCSTPVSPSPLALSEPVSAASPTMHETVESPVSAADTVLMPPPLHHVHHSRDHISPVVRAVRNESSSESMLSSPIPKRT